MLRYHTEIEAKGKIFLHETTKTQLLIKEDFSKLHTQWLLKCYTKRSVILNFRITL